MIARAVVGPFRVSGVGNRLSAFSVQRSARAVAVFVDKRGSCRSERPRSFWLQLSDGRQNGRRGQKLPARGLQSPSTASPRTAIAEHSRPEDCSRRARPARGLQSPSTAGPNTATGERQLPSAMPFKGRSVAITGASSGIGQDTRPETRRPRCPAHAGRTPCGQARGCSRELPRSRYWCDSHPDRRNTAPRLPGLRGCGRLRVRKARHPH